MPRLTSDFARRFSVCLNADGTPKGSKNGGPEAMVSDGGGATHAYFDCLVCRAPVYVPLTVAHEHRDAMAVELHQCPIE